MSEQFGPLAAVVTAAGDIVAAAVAVGLAWRPRTSWEPAEEDLPGGAQKLSVLVAGAGIVLMWAEFRDPSRTGALDRLLIALPVLALLLFGLYAFLVGSHTYVLYQGQDAERRVLGGFRLTGAARTAAAERGIEDPQQLLPGFAYEPASVWTRGSRQLARSLCSAVYALFLIAGTTALAAAAIRLGLVAA